MGLISNGGIGEFTTKNFQGCARCEPTIDYVTGRVVSEPLCIRSMMNCEIAS